MTPSQTTPQPGDRLVAAIEAQTMAIERAMVKAFWIQIVGPSKPDAGAVGAINEGLSRLDTAMNGGEGAGSGLKLDLGQAVVKAHNAVGLIGMATGYVKDRNDGAPADVAFVTNLAKASIGTYTVPAGAAGGAAALSEVPFVGTALGGLGGGIAGGVVADQVGGLVGDAYAGARGQVIKGAGEFTDNLKAVLRHPLCRLRYVDGGK